MGRLADLPLLVLDAAGVLAIVSVLSLRWLQERRRSCPERAIEEHILRTQVPAKALGIRCTHVSAQSLTLSAPLELNHNVHGTAFAGSLYAVAVLSAYYLGRDWVQRQGLQGYDLVAKRGRIEYKRPVQAAIAARSWLPSAEELARFQATLVRDGKAFLEICGNICSDEDAAKIQCEYAIEVCAFVPRVRS